MNVIIIITTISFWVACLFMGIRIFLYVTNKVTEDNSGGPADPFSAGVMVYPGMMCALAVEIVLIYAMHISSFGRALKIIPFFCQ